MKLEFGKQVHVGNFVFIKLVKTLSRREMKALRAGSGIPEEIACHLERGKLPYIKASTAVGSWSVEWVIGQKMYENFDSLNIVVDDKGVHQLYGVEERNVHALLNSMMCDTCLLGDFEYNSKKQVLISEYLDRAAKEKNRKEDEGKTEEELRKESDEAAQEVLDAESAKSKLDEISSEIDKEGGDGHDNK